jgi:hypothetical protein
MAIYAIAGAKFYLGTTLPIDFTTPASALAAFLTDTFLQVGNAETIGDFGDTAADVTFTGLSDLRTQHLKGTFDGGTLQLTCAYNASDAGQQAMKAAFKSPNDFNFKVAYNDTPTVLNATVTVTIASPGVVSWTGHGFSGGEGFKFSTTGALPTGVTAGVTYYVLPASLTSNTFQFAATPGGTAIVTTGTQSGIHTGITVPTGSATYFRGKVMSFKRINGTGPNNVIKLQMDVGINTDQIEVLADD